MKPEYTEFWDSPVHRDFVEALSVDRVDALHDLLLIAALVDELLTVEERAQIANALMDLPGLDHPITFDHAEAIDHVDDLYARYENEGDDLLDELLARLGSTLDLSHALEAVVALMATNNHKPAEALFARRLGVLMDVPDDFVENLLERFGW